MSIFDRFMRGLKEYLDSTRHMIPFLLFLLLLFSGLLFYEFRKMRKSGTGEIIGTVTYKTRAVRVKADSTVVWQEIEQKQPLSRRDTIQSLEQSDVLITLNDGTQLKIEENSMVILDFTENKMNLDFRYGSIRTRRNSDTEKDSLVIHSDGVKVSLKEGDLNLNKKEKEDLKVISTKGEASIQKGETEYQLKEKSSAVVREKELPSIKEMDVSLASPNPSQIFLIKEKSAEIPFTWNSGFGKNKIQFCKNYDFINIYKENIVNGKSFTAKFGAGIYYWRVVNPSAKDVSESEIRRFTVSPDIPFQFRYPSNGSEFSLKSGKGTYVSFSWDRLDNMHSYTLELSRSPDLSSVEKRYDSSGSSFGAELTDEGKYYFRVRANPANSQIQEKITGIGYFTLKKMNTYSPPVLVNPKNGSEFEGTHSVLLGWKDDSAYSLYSLVIAENSSFTENARVIKSKDNYYHLEKVKVPAVYFWKVEGLDSESRKLVSSETYSFRISEKKKRDVSLRDGAEETDSEEKWEPPYSGPVLIEPINRMTAELKEPFRLNFRWKKQKQETDYRFFLFRTVNSAEVPVLVKDIRRNRLELDSSVISEEGRYKWYVEGRYIRDGKAASLKSPKQEFRILPLLTAPKIKKSEEIYYINEK